jgi:hypothetical protein
MTDTRFVRGASRVRRRIASIQAATTVALNPETLGKLLLDRVKKRFKRGVSPDGTKWPPLEPATKLRKAKSQFKGPLMRSGTLFNAIKVIRGTHAGLFAGATGAGFRIGVSDPKAAEYGRLMNNGFYHVRAKRMIEPRRFMGVGELDRKAVDSALRAIILRNTIGG